jgi:hypothetical protein
MHGLRAAMQVAANSTSVTMNATGIGTAIPNAANGETAKFIYVSVDYPFITTGAAPEAGIASDIFFRCRCMPYVTGDTITYSEMMGITREAPLVLNVSGFDLLRHQCADPSPVAFPIITITPLENIR